MLLTHRLSGPILNDWNQHRVVRRHIKLSSTALLLVSMSMPLFFMGLPLWARAMVLVAFAAIITWIWSFKSEPDRSD